MSTATFVFLKKVLVAKPIQSFVLACFLGGLICTAHTAFANPPEVTIAVDPPTINGTMEFEIVDLKFNRKVMVKVEEIEKGDKCDEKAGKVYVATLNAIKVAKLKGIVKVSLSGRKVKVYVDYDGNQGIQLNQVKDNTGEKNLLITQGKVAAAGVRTRSGQSNGTDASWFFAFTIWLSDDSNAVVPDGTVMTMTPQKPGRITFPVSVTGNGVLTVAQLQGLAISEFEALGVSFTPVTDPETGLNGFMSQSFPGTNSQGGGRVNWNAAWSTYLGGAGVQAVPAP